MCDAYPPPLTNTPTQHQHQHQPNTQIRVGAGNEQRGKAFVVYEDIYDAKSALEHLNGFNVCGRYLVVLYYQPEKQQRRMDLEKQRKEVEELRKVRCPSVGGFGVGVV